MGREGKTSLQEGALQGRDYCSSLELLVASTERPAEGRALVLPMNPCMSGVQNQARRRSYLALSHCEPHTFTRAVGPGPFQREAQGLPDRDTPGCVPRGCTAPSHSLETISVTKKGRLDRHTGDDGSR